MKDAEFRAFFKNERQKLIRYVQSLLHETAAMDAEDVVHDVLVRFLERSNGADSLESVAAFAYRSLKNRVIDFTRTRKRTISIEQEAVEGELRIIDILVAHGPNADELLQSEQGERLLFEALNRLSDIERSVVIAHEFEGQPFRELSIAWGIPQNTLLSHKSRALKKLQEHLLNLK